jgi:radical SAM protein with 4Fe4S-binding SPASM domain
LADESCRALPETPTFPFATKDPTMSDTIELYNKLRAPQLATKAFHSICYAPFVSLLFDTKGYVRSCCQSFTHSIGNITQQTLKEIWNGKVNHTLRESMMANDLGQGCATCKWDIERSNFDQAFSRHFDMFSAASPTPQWPVNMWFLMSNACNLECVQCYGELSSSIRKHRDHLPPLKRVYQDSFFEELREFLPHLQLVLFLGGEAFLSRENYRIWDMMIEDRLTTPTHIVTNGTQYNDRVERIIRELPCSISISIDGATRETVESIRRNSSFDEIMTNIKRFQKFARVDLSFCLMPQNQHEFGDFLILAEELGCGASVNTVFHPAEFSLCALPKDQLAKVVTSWESRSSEILPRLDRHRHIWVEEINRVKHWVSVPEGPPSFLYLSGVAAPMAAAAFARRSAPGSNRVAQSLPVLNQLSEQASGGPDRPDGERVRLAYELLSEWSNGRVQEAELDERDVVACQGTTFGGLEGQDVTGKSLSSFLMRLRERYGEDVNITAEECTAAHMDRTMEFTNLLGERTQLRWIAISRESARSGRKPLLLAVRQEH